MGAVSSKAKKKVNFRLAPDTTDTITPSRPPVKNFHDVSISVSPAQTPLNTTEITVEADIQKANPQHSISPSNTTVSKLNGKKSVTKTRKLASGTVIRRSDDHEALARVLGLYKSNIKRSNRISVDLITANAEEGNSDGVVNGDRVLSHHDAKADPEVVCAKHLMEMKRYNRGRICVKVKGDSDTCFITGSALLSTERMVIVDHNNAALKLVDTVSYVVSTTLRLTSKPRDVTVLSKLDAIAVTLTEECKIQFFSTRYYNTFDELTSLYVDGKCECIDFLNGKLYVSFLFTSPSRIDVMTLDGVVVKRLTRDQQGAPLLTWPDYLTVHEDYIFITNYWNNTVLKISPEGETVKTYVDSELRWPRGVTSTGDGHILICSRHTNNVHLMTTECEKVGVVLGPRDGLVGPWSVCYCPKSQTIYVSSYSRKDNSNNYLQVYRFK